MLEEKSYEEIRDEMLNEVSDEVDKREGSIIFDAVAPTAMKLAEFQSELKVFLGLVFADTSDGEYLERRTAELGIYRKLATPAIRKGTFRDSESNLMDIDVDSRFSLDNIIFRAVEKESTGIYKLESETAGTIGNQGTGDILPVEPIEGLGSAEITDVIVAGTDDETDESLYARYLIRTRKQATSGNVYHYEQWALEVPGVGGVKVVPTWDGPNTVKVIVISDNKEPVDPGIISNVENHIEEERPIGAIVTVVSASSLAINVTADLHLASGANISDVTTDFENALEEYLQSLAFVTNPSTEQPELIRYTRIANILLDVPQVIDFENLEVNGAVSNIQPTDEQVGVLGSVNFNEI